MARPATVSASVSLVSVPKKRPIQSNVPLASSVNLLVLLAISVFPVQLKELANPVTALVAASRAWSVLVQIAATPFVSASAAMTAVVPKKVAAVFLPVASASVVATTPDAAPTTPASQSPAAIRSVVPDPAKLTAIVETTRSAATVVASRNPVATIIQSATAVRSVSTASVKKTVASAVSTMQTVVIPTFAATTTSAFPNHRLPAKTTRLVTPTRSAKAASVFPKPPVVVKRIRIVSPKTDVSMTSVFFEKVSAVPMRIVRRVMPAVKTIVVCLLQKNLTTQSRLPMLV